MGLDQYRKKRKFQKTPEPKGKKAKGSKKPIFVVQKHHARRLHYDFRLEIGGVLASWAVPKGLPKTMGVKHLAVHTEDHPLEYAKFEGTIPEGEYGAGKVKIVDSGTYENLKTSSMKKCVKDGVIDIRLYGKKLKGAYALVHFKEKNWLLMKVRIRRK